jgi:DNA-binding NarL/FixJ family response regulator
MSSGIALVDNFAGAIPATRDFLEREGYVVDVATSVDEARQLDRLRSPELWIIDLRLRDDTDDKDTSGLLLARELRTEVPKILLTSYPTVKAVREALALGHDGRSPAITFVSKREGLESLARAVRLALMPRNESLLRALGSSTMNELSNRIEQLGAERASLQLRDFIDTQRRALAEQQDLAGRRAAESHRIGVVASAAGFVLILGAIAASLAGTVSTATVMMAGSLIINTTSALFCVNADKAHRRLREFLQQQEDLLKVANLLDLCNTFENRTDRDQNRQAVFDWFLNSLTSFKSESTEPRRT